MKNNVFGKNLKELRVNAGLSQKALGDVFNLSNQTISTWETGTREPDLDALVKIADFFGVSFDDLLLDVE